MLSNIWVYGWGFFTLTCLIAGGFLIGWALLWWKVGFITYLNAPTERRHPIKWRA